LQVTKGLRRQELILFVHFRELQYSEDESKAIRCVTNELHIYNPGSFDQGIAEKLRVEGITSVCISPGRAPSVAVFVAEKKVRESLFAARVWFPF
jgi:uncharacterized protein with WD repeat